jgi:hypothetical protein|tara:strand:+ start:90 stop:344 length:255 start_codon:yes stop_codon:yes gene_type:complete
MAKYKKIHESFGENFVAAIFRTIGKGIRPAVLRVLSKKDPEVAKLIKRVEDSRNDVEDYISKKIKNTKIPKSKQKALNRGEWPF